ncbi:ubiquitin-like domain-containing protein, partial [Streptomyces xiamenensis]|uniref:ubiquitin-like domain-containing protein n=1 Tax=Streptomyces xiamenensis TaxID=408015 RepID=UPI00367B9C58
TVEGALRQFGIRAEGAHLSAPRTAPVPRAGMALGVRTERSVTFMADGRERTIRTNAATVQEALDQAGITLHGQDGHHEQGRQDGGPGGTAAAHGARRRVLPGYRGVCGAHFWSRTST